MRHACVSTQNSFGSKRQLQFGSRFGEWRVCWVGGWPRDRLSYLVILVRVDEPVREDFSNAHLLTRQHFPALILSRPLLCGLEFGQLLPAQR